MAQRKSAAKRAKVGQFSIQVYRSVDQLVESFSPLRARRQTCYATSARGWYSRAKATGINNSYLQGAGEEQHNVFFHLSDERLP